MVVGYTTIYAIGAYHHWCCEFESRSWQGVQHYVIKFVSDLRQVGGFLHQCNLPPRYSWNIVESGIKHHQENNQTNKLIVWNIVPRRLSSYTYKLVFWSITRANIPLCSDNDLNLSKLILFHRINWFVYCVSRNKMLSQRICFKHQICICYLDVNWLIPKISACRARIWSLVASERSERVTNFIFCLAGWYFSVSIILTFRWHVYHPYIK